MPAGDERIDEGGRALRLDARLDATGAHGTRTLAGGPCPRPTPAACRASAAPASRTDAAG
jgi:hypothetical protein